MAIDVKRQHDLQSHYFLPMRTSLKRSRCYLAEDVDTLVADLRTQLNGLYEMNTEEFAKHHRQVSDLRDCIKAADNAGLKALEQYLSDFFADAFEQDMGQVLHDRMQQRIKWQAGLIDETIETRKNKGTYKGEFTTAVILANAYNDIFENQYKDFDVKEGESK